MSGSWLAEDLGMSQKMNERIVKPVLLKTTMELLHLLISVLRNSGL